MSFEAAAWAIQQRTERTLEKLVLVVLADCYNKNNSRCDPSITHLADLSLCTRRAAMSAIASLERQGFLSTKKAPGIRTKYTLNITSTGERKGTGESLSLVNETTPTGERNDTGVVNETTPEPVINQEEPGKERNIRLVKPIKSKAVDQDIPDFIDQPLWNEYLAIRLQLKAKNTPLAVTKIINKLTKFHDGGMDPNESLENSVVNSWKGVFPPNRSKAHGSNKNPTAIELATDNNW